MKTFLLSCLAVLSFVSVGRAQTPTVIDHLPYVINTRGLYVLTNSLSSDQTTGNLITINASNVIIDLQGNFISGPVGSLTQITVGIYADERNNITIKNGTIANVSSGIFLGSNGSQTTNNLNHELDHLSVTRCVKYGISFGDASSCSVTNCKVSAIGSNQIVTSTYAISAIGAGVTVQNCSVSQGLGSNPIGISLAAGSFARQNTISNYAYGVINGTYQDNLTYGCIAPFSGGTDAGGNK